MTTVHVWPGLKPDGTSITVLAEDGVTPIPAVGGAIVPYAEYYIGLLGLSQLLTFDPLELSGDPITVPPITRVSGSLTGIVTTSLSTRVINSDGEVVVTTGYATSGDGGGCEWRGALGVSAGASYDKINCSNGQWQVVHDSKFINARWLGAGIGAGSDAARLNAAVAALPSSGELYMPAGTYVWDIASTFVVPNNLHVRGDGPSTVYRRNDAHGAINAQGKTGVTISDLTIEMDFFVNFMRLVDLTVGATNCTVRNVIAYLTESAAASIVLGSNTLHFVLADNSTDITVEGCRTKYLQVKLATFGSARRMRVLNNYFDHPVDYAASVVASGVTSAEFSDIEIRGNIINLPEASGVFYVGHDSESGRIAKMDRVAIDDNFVLQDRQLGGVQVLVHLGDVSNDISICRNMLRNIHTPLDNSSLIRVRSTQSGKIVDGLQISQNLLYGAEQAGIWVDVHGRNIQIKDNEVRSTRGIYVYAANGDIDGIQISGNTAANSIHHGFWVYALTGNIRGLRMRDNDAYDAYGAPSGQNAGYWIAAESGMHVRGVASGCTAGNRQLTSMDYGFYQLGTGDVEVAYRDCEAFDVLTGFLRLDSGSASGHDNRGFGTVPNTEDASVLLADVSTASTADVKCPCDGVGIRVLFVLGGAITGSNANVTTLYEPPGGGGFVTITNGGATIVAAGSALGTRFVATPTAANVFERGGTLRVSTDGASSTTATLRAMFVISKVAP